MKGWKPVQMVIIIACIIVLFITVSLAFYQIGYSGIKRGSTSYQLVQMLLAINIITLIFLVAYKSILSFRK